MKNWKNRELIKIGWEKTKENFWFLIAVMLLSYVASFLGDMVHLGFVVNIFTSFIITSTFVSISRGEKVGFNNLFAYISGPKLLHYLIGVFVTSVFVIAGIALFVVPGIIIGIMLAFVSYILVDEKKDLNWKTWAFWDAIKKVST